MSQPENTRLLSAQELAEYLGMSVGCQNTVKTQSIKNCMRRYTVLLCGVGRHWALRGDLLSLHWGSRTCGLITDPVMTEIRLSNGMIARVDDADAELVSRFRWFPRADKRERTVYAVSHGPGKVRKVAGRTIDGRPTISMHRLIMGFPQGIIVDHWDGDGLNNRRYNLRRGTTATNGMNRRKQLTPTTSKYKGVYLCGATGKWVAIIQPKSLGLSYVKGGSFTDEEQAARRYDELARQYFGEFARLNFPEAV